MAVAIVDTGTATYNASGTTQNFTFTIGATATAAQVDIALDATQTISSVTWDPTGANQALTLVASKSCFTTTHGLIAKYGIVNPTAGASKTLRVALATATGCSAQLQSYNGTIISSVAACFTNALTAQAASGSVSSANIGTAAQSGASGDMYVSAFVCNTVLATTPVNGTLIYFLSPAGNDAAGSRIASTGTSVQLLWTVTNNGSDWAAVSCDIVAAAAGPIARELTVLQAAKRASYW